MKGWPALAAGTRLWRNAIIAQLVVTVVGVIGAMVWTFGWMARNASKFEGDPLAAQAALQSELLVWTVVFAVIGLAFSAILVAVARQWGVGPDVGPALEKARHYEFMAIGSLVLQGVIVVMTFASDSGPPGALTFLGNLIPFVMLLTALRMHALFLQAQGAPPAELADQLRNALLGMVLGAVVATMMAGALGMLGALLVIGIFIGGIVWFVYFIIFLGRALAVYDNRSSVRANVFD